MGKFVEFLKEQNGEEPYKLIVFNHSGEMVRDIKDTGLGELIQLMNKSSKSAGIETYNVDFVGCYLSEKNGKKYINSFPFDDDGVVIYPDMKGDGIKYQDPIEIDPKNTIIMPRGLGTVSFTSSRSWVDMIAELELDGFLTIPSLDCWDICASKNMTDVMCKNAGLKTPKTITIAHSEDTERAFKELNKKFPIILKSSTGTQTGVGVVVIESMRSLQAMVQMILLYNKYLPIIIQEYIETDYDMRVVVCNGEVMGAMKRNVIKGDVRSNASLGAKTEEIELTDLEKTEAIKIAKASKCSLAGVDLIPSKDRENEKPYCLEVNANLGYAGIEKVIKGKSVTKEILKHFMNRENWRI